MNNLNSNFPLVYQELLNLERSGFNKNDAVWVFASPKPITNKDEQLILLKLNNFIAEWYSHQFKVTAKSFIFFQQFIVMVAQEINEPISGCSKDSLFKQIIAIEKEFSMSFLNPLNLFFYHPLKQVIEIYDMNECKQNPIIKDTLKEYLYFDNTVKTLSGLCSNWLIPFHTSQVFKNLFI